MNINFLHLSMLLVAAVSVSAEDWPRFRGPGGQGVSHEKNPTLYWSNSSNILWKATIPGESWSSPVITEGSVYLTTATENGTSCRIIRLDAKTGAQSWNKEVFKQETRRKEGKNTYATPTPIADGDRIYAIFGSGSMVAVSAQQGNVVWTNHTVRFYSQHGLGASPLIYKNLLIEPFDGSSEGPDKAVGWQKPWDQSFILAVDKNTGKEVWRAKRGSSRIAHVSPIVLEEKGQAQLVTGAGDVIQGFDLGQGNLIWTARHSGEGVVPSIVLGDGLIYGCTGFLDLKIRAIRTGGKGDVTDTHVAWESKKTDISMASYLYVAPYLYAVSSTGLAQCMKAQTGEIVWQHKLGGTFSASPVWVDGRIFFLSEKGKTTVIAEGAEYKELAQNDLEEACQASMAVSNGRLYIRTENNLYCIGQP